MEDRQHHLWAVGGKLPSGGMRPEKNRQHPHPKAIAAKVMPPPMALVLIPQKCWLGRFFVGLTSYPSDFLDILA